MAGTSLFALIDDIAAILDDVALMSKVAAKKTVGVLGDDLALNAQQLGGINAERELPVVWAVAKGSLVNKAILVPGALAISVLLPWAIVPLLMAGGVYLCYEGVEKLAHRWLHGPGDDLAHEAELEHALADPAIDLMALEKDKIKGAIRTDFILSAEIIVIALGSVAGAPFAQRLWVLCAVAVLITAGVYGLVAAIVKLDDGGLYLLRRGGAAGWRRVARVLGGVLLAAAPRLMQALSVLGTAAMFTVGGGIIAHGLPGLPQWMEGVEHGARALPLAGPALAMTASTLIDALVGIAAGALALALMTAASGVMALVRKK
ncbi:MAG: DUF808 domain-containing protein [Pseudomonadota bacterium]